ncbi:MAG: glycosyltransferase family 2 protein [Thermocrispum sp.]
MNTDIGCIVLTQGKRPAELRRAVDSILRQHGVTVDVVVVGNGGKPENLPDEVRVVVLPRDVGVPAGRNAGNGATTGDLLLYLDDDAYLRGDDFLARAAAQFDADPELGIVQPRVLDPEGKRTPRRYVPRLRVGDDKRSSEVVALWEGTVVARRTAVDKAGWWPDEFHFMHEGIELAWRVMDAGYVVRYSGGLETYHPAVTRDRNSDVPYMSARNRVWLARRNLPVLPAIWYVTTWLVLDFLRVRSVRGVRQQLRGYLDGLRKPCGQRRPISWRTVMRMTKAGRPPII